MVPLFKKPLFYIFVFILAIFVVGGVLLFSTDTGPTYETEIVMRGEILEEVTVTGRVLPSDRVDLAFERSGRVTTKNVTVGDSILKGDSIAELDHSELSAQLLQAEANVSAELARLLELERGLRPEERDSYETRVANAEKTLANALEKQLTVIQKAKDDLTSAYNDAEVLMKNAVTAGKSALLVATDIQYAYFNSYSTEDSAIASFKESAVAFLLGREDAGRWSNDSLSKLSGGLFGEVYMEDNAQTTIDALLINTLDALTRIRSFLNAIPITTQLSSTEKTNMSSAKTSIENQITLISNSIQSITAQKVMNENARTIAQAEVTSAENGLANAKADLTVGNAGSANEQIDAQLARVRSAEAQVENLTAQISKTIITAPLSGIITKSDVVVGEIVSPGTVYFSIISEDLFEIDAFIPEADIAKVSLGDSARVTLDAYGRDEVFPASVTEINPAETIIDGVATYKITLQFNEKDSRVRSGMTANIDIVTNEKKGVLKVPLRSVIRRDGEYFVRTVAGQSELNEVKVTTGLRGVDGMIEIVNGLKEGETVVTYYSE
ncbi:MAG: efflux RND transporter periplasmic adaptor subunit [Candidatus Paceibacterota bacterium]